MAEADPRALLRESARGFAARHLGAARQRRLRTTPTGFDAATWRGISEMGWPALLLPEADGGFGLGLQDLAAVLEELGAALLPEPLVPCAVLAGGMLARADNRDLAGDLLARLVAGELLPAAAWQEGFAALEEGCATSAERVGTALRVDGAKRFIRPGEGADGHVVTARLEGGVALLWLPRGTPGATLASERAVDGGTVGRLDLAGVELPAAHLLCGPASGARVLAAALDDALVATAAELLGLTRRAIEMTLAYLRTREQFGRPIGSFQALQHRAVDLWLQQELTAAAIADAAARIDAGGLSPAERGALASRVKARASDAALLATREAVQMHGAIGFTDEHDIGLLMKRALVLAAWLGSAAEHRRRYARLAPPPTEGHAA